MARVSKARANRRPLRGGVKAVSAQGGRRRRGRTSKRAARIHSAMEHTAPLRGNALASHPYHTDRPSMPGARPLTYPG